MAVRALGLAFLAGSLGLSSLGCSMAPSIPQSANDGSEDGVESRITQLVHQGISKQKLQAVVVVSETPYLRYTASQFDTASGIVQEAFRTACREAGGIVDSSGYEFGLLHRKPFTEQRGSPVHWPQMYEREPSVLLMDTSAETGEVEAAMYVNRVCRLPNQKEAVILGNEDRLGMSPFNPVKPDIKQFYSQPDQARIFWASLGSFDRYAANVPGLRSARNARAKAMSDSLRPALQAHNNAEREKAQAQEAAQARSRESRASIARAAAARFNAASGRSLQGGMTVCSTDNRVGYVEQIAPPRLKVAIRGRAIGTYGEFGAVGPFSLGSWGRHVDFTEPEPIEDKHFLFQSLQKQVRISQEPAVVWDEVRFWAVCDYR